MVRKPSYALAKIIRRPDQKPIWNRTTPTVLERTTELINSTPMVLFARRKNCQDSQKIQNLLSSKYTYRLVYLDDMPLGDIMQRRLQDLTGQWTVPNLFIKGQSVGGLSLTQDALRIGRVDEMLNEKGLEMVYEVKPDWVARQARFKEKSELSFAMSLQDSPKFNYVHKERWAEVKRYWGLHPEIEEFPLVRRSSKKKKVRAQTYTLL